MTIISNERCACIGMSCAVFAPRVARIAMLVVIFRKSHRNTVSVAVALFMNGKKADSVLLAGKHGKNRHKESGGDCRVSEREKEVE